MQLEICYTGEGHFTMKVKIWDNIIEALSKGIIEL